MTPADALTPSASPVQPRPDLVASITGTLVGAEDSRPAPLLIVEGARGMGKTTLLHAIAKQLRTAGVMHAFIDVERVCVGPVDVALHLPAIISATFRGIIGKEREPECPLASAAENRIAEEVARVRPDPRLLLRESFGFAETLSRDLSRPLVLLLDEMGELLRLGRSATLRDAGGIVAEVIAASIHVPVVASVSPVSRAGALVDGLLRHAERAGRPAWRVAIPPLVGADLPRDLDRPTVERILAITAGRAHYASRLANALLERDRIRSRDDPLLEAVLLEELTPPDGILHQECRFEYHLLVGRCRGDAVVRNLLRFIAGGPGISLTPIARHLRIAPPTALDYLSWMLEVGLIIRRGRGYHVADPLLRLWVILNGPVPVRRAETIREHIGTLRDPLAAPLPAHAPSSDSITSNDRRHPTGAAPRSGDSLIEID